MLPFLPGRYEGAGHWIDQKTEGDYTVAYVIASAPESGWAHTVQSSQGEVNGSGYCFDRQCHYDADIAPDNHLEWTFNLGPGTIESLASSTNKGNFTSWKETLKETPKLTP